MTDTTELHAQVCIAGGGPAGMLAGYLFARSGVDVVVLEKHAGFLRDFRGDTVHPSTLELMHELGLLDEFLKEPHQRVDTLNAVMGEEMIPLVDFSHLPVECPYIALMPQWDFLDFLAQKAKAYPGFRLIMQANVHALQTDSAGHITGVKAITPDGPLTVTAPLTIGADGRGSTVRSEANLPVTDSNVPIDVMWFRLTRHPEDTDETMAIFRTGYMMVMLNRGDYWQCAYVIAKNGADQIRQAGLEAFRKRIQAATGFTANRMQEIASMDEVKLLTVKVDHLKTWHREGLLCIGDAAHAMSPVGGVGINLALQDAVACVNLLAPLCLSGELKTSDLDKVRKRRLFPARMTQRMQTFLHRQVIYRTLEQDGEFKPPLFLRVVTRIPLLRRLMARAIGLGIRPEHIDPEIIPLH